MIEFNAQLRGTENRSMEHDVYMVRQAWRKLHSYTPSASISTLISSSWMVLSISNKYHVFWGTVIMKLITF